MAYLMIYLVGFFPSLYLITKGAGKDDSNNFIFWLTVVWPLSIPILGYVYLQDKFEETNIKLYNPLNILIDRWRNKWKKI